MSAGIPVEASCHCQLKPRLILYSPKERLPSFPHPTHGDYLARREAKHIGAYLEKLVTIGDAIRHIPMEASDHDPNALSGNTKWEKPASSYKQPLKGTILTTREQLWHPNAHRRYTVRETACLQGFPASHEFRGSNTKKLRQIGNAVPPPVAKAILQEVRRSLRQHDGLDDDDDMEDYNDESGTFSESQENLINMMAKSPRM